MKPKYFLFLFFPYIIGYWANFQREIGQFGISKLGYDFHTSGIWPVFNLPYPFAFLARDIGHIEQGNVGL